jgi:hypothetical protein
VSDAEKAAIRGYTKTIQALDFLVVINTRDTNGAPIDVNRPLGDLAPIASKDEVFAHIAKLLDEAAADLQAGGNSFPFALSSGFEGFSTPASFLKFNRAVRARVHVYRGEYPQAMTALQGSFLDTEAGLEEGVYHTFGTGTGEVSNLLNSPTIYAHPSLVTDADKKANGEVDNRVSTKLKTVKAGSGGDGKLSSDRAFTMYGPSAPVPIIRNEELILLRAEAHIGMGNLDGAVADINFIRQTSGGLPARNDLTPANVLEELLKQKRYSLMFEGGHRWLDLRRYGKLDTLPKEYGDYPVHQNFPIPQSELDARQ